MKIFVRSLLFCFLLFASSTNFYALSAQCDAAFEYTEYDGPLPTLGGITFDNQSTGVYTDFSWDFGDGSYDTQTTGSLTHFYEQSGTYEVTLTIWSDNTEECFDQYSQSIEVMVSDDPCDLSTCVWPGDTNADGQANMADLINIGLGFGVTGPVRDSSSLDWVAQPADDWEMENGLGINYKHFDCNGDGMIDLSDIEGIQQNYVNLDNGTNVSESGGIPISLSFNVDTVVITDPDQHLEVSAALTFGNSAAPMDEVFGVVLYLTYPEHYVMDDNPVDFDYNYNSFFGGAEEVLPLARNLQEEGQMDIVLARMNAQNASGQGRVATVTFIIDSDIIDGRVINDGQEFPVMVNLVEAVDIDGNSINIDLPDEPTGVFFQNGIVTSVQPPILKADQFQVNPNPVLGNLQIAVSDDVHPESIEVLDLLGRRIWFQENVQQQMELNLSTLHSGVYILKLKAEEGVGTRRILKR